MIEALVTAVLNWIMAIESKILIAGLFGAFARNIILKIPFTWQSILTMIVGMTFAAYFTPVAIFYFGPAIALVDPNLSNALAFFFGLIGLSLTEALLKVTTKFLNDPKLPSGLVDFFLQYISAKYIGTPPQAPVPIVIPVEPVNTTDNAAEEPADQSVIFTEVIDVHDRNQTNNDDSREPR